jgi:dethiobiotin synthetase
VSPERKTLLITGTDTGVGKTFVACALGRALAARKLRVAPFKPVETGCREHEGALLAEDAERLRHATGTDAPTDLVCPVRLRDPLAPMVAAEREGVTIDVERLAASFRELASANDVVLVESAGGLLVPLTETCSFADFASMLALPVLVVAGTRLGAINQTLLTLEVLRARGLETVGYVLNRLTTESDLAQETNAHALARLAGRHALAEIPYVSGAAEGERLLAFGRALADKIF